MLTLLVFWHTLYVLDYPLDVRSSEVLVIFGVKIVEHSFDDVLQELLIWDEIGFHLEYLL